MLPQSPDPQAGSGRASWSAQNDDPVLSARDCAGDPERRKPSGTLNFSKADRPTLWMDIQDTLPNSRGQKKVMLRATTIGWGLYRIEGQRGALFFGN